MFGRTIATCFSLAEKWGCTEASMDALSAAICPEEKMSWNALCQFQQREFVNGTDACQHGGNRHFTAVSS